MLKKLIPLILAFSVLFSSLSQAGILTGIAQGYGGDDIDSSRFRLSDETDKQGLYGSRYGIEVASRSTQPLVYDIVWGGSVFLRNSPKDYSKDIRDYSWVVGESSIPSMDYSDNGKWLTDRYKKNWSVSTPSQIVPTDEEIVAIINQIWSKTADKSKFGGITKDDLLNKRYNFRITVESMVLINLPSGTKLNGKTWDSNDSVWVTYNEFYKIARLLEVTCNGDSNKIDAMRKKMAPLHVLFMKPNTVNGVEYYGNMAVSLYCEGRYEGWGWHRITADWSTSQAVICITALKSKDSNVLKVVDVSDAVLLEPGVQESTHFKLPDSSFIREEYSVDLTGEVAAAKGYFRYLAPIADEFKQIEVMLNRTILTVDGNPVTYDTLLSNTSERPIHPDSPILIAEEPVGGYRTEIFAPLEYNGTTPPVKDGVKSDTIPEIITLSLDTEVLIKHPKYVMYIFEGEFIEPVQVFCTDKTPMSTNPNPALPYSPPETQSKMNVKLLKNEYFYDKYNAELPFKGFTVETSGGKKIIQVAVTGHNTEKNFPKVGADFYTGNFIDSNTKFWPAEEALAMSMGELLKPVEGFKYKEVIVVYDNELVASAQEIGSIKANQLTKQITSKLKSAEGEVELPDSESCPKKKKVSDEPPEGATRRVRCGADLYYSWNGYFDLRYAPSDVFNSTGTKVVKQGGKYLNSTDRSTSASAKVESLTIPSVDVTYVTHRKAGTTDGNLYIASQMNKLNNPTATNFLGLLGYTAGIKKSEWYTGVTAPSFTLELVVPNLTGSRPYKQRTHHGYGGKSGSASAVTVTSKANRETDVSLSVTPFYAGATIPAAGDVAKEVKQDHYYRIEKTGTAIPYTPAIKCTVDYSVTGPGTGDVYITGKQDRSFKPIDVFEFKVDEKPAGNVKYSAPWSRDKQDTDSTIKAGTLYKMEGSDSASTTITVNSFIAIPKSGTVANADSIRNTRLAEHNKFVDSVINSMEIESYSSVPYNYNTSQTLKNTNSINGVSYNSVPDKYRGQTIAPKGFSVSRGAVSRVNNAILSQYNAAYGSTLASLESTTLNLLNGDSFNTVSNSVARLKASMDKSNYGGYYVEEFPGFEVVKQTTVLNVTIPKSSSVTYITHPRISDFRDKTNDAVNRLGLNTAIGSIPSKKFGVGLAFNFKNLKAYNSSTKYTWYNRPQIFNIRGTVTDSR